MFAYKSDFVVVSMSNTVSIPVIKYTDFSVQYVLNRTVGCSAYSAVFDNLKGDAYYEIWADSNQNYFLVVIDVSKKSNLHKNFPDLALPDTVYSNILNFGPYQYLAVITGQGASLPFAFSFVYKANHTFAAVLQTDFPAVTDFERRSLIGTSSFDTKHYFSFIDVDGSKDSNVHSYYLELDRCNERDAVDPTLCLQCIEPFYRNTVDPGNVCLVLPYYPDRQGPNKDLNVLQFCHQTECLKCQANYTECQVCDLAQQLYLNSTGNKQCVSYSDIGLLSNPSWGVTVKNSEGTVTKCATGCINCLASQAFCNNCNTPTYMRDAAQGKCYNDTTCPSGKGRNVSTHLLVTCTSTNCTQCCPNSEICSACSGTGVYVWDLDPPARCRHYSDAPAGIGANTTSKKYVACQETGCDDCKQDHKVCVSCLCRTEGYFYNTSSGKCLHQLSLSSEYGGDLTTGTVETCKIVGCSDCRGDVLKCELCNSTAGYFLHQNKSLCTLAQNLASGPGAHLLSGLVTPCSSDGCLDCRFDNSKCTLCNVQNQRMLVFSKCEGALTSSQRTGMDLDDSTNKPCQDQNCLNCSLNIKVCTGCE